MEIAKLTSSLLDQGIRLELDNQTGFKIYVSTKASGRSTDTAIKLLNLLQRNQSEAITFLSIGGGKYKNGGIEMKITIDVNINAQGLEKALIALANALPMNLVKNETAPVKTAQQEVLKPISEGKPQPEVAKPKGETQPETPSQPDPAPAPEESPKEVSKPVVTLEQVRAKLAQLSQSGKQAQVKELIQNFGATKLTEIPDEKFGELLAAAEVL